MFTYLFLKSLNREAASPKNSPEKVLEYLNIREGDVIADLGSGGGFYTLQFARKAGKTGKVYAIDVKTEYLDFIKSRVEREGLVNIVFVNAAEKEKRLPEGGLDLIFTRNVFHHLPEPEHYFQGLKRFLKPEGRLVIIEHKPKSGFSFVALFKHFTPVESIRQALDQAGFALKESPEILSGQTFNVFLPILNSHH